MLIRTEISSDIGEVRSVHELAFGRPDEANLVDALRKEGSAVLSIVAAEHEQIIRHILFSRMIAPFRALGLGPVAVLPERQRNGIGSRLIRGGLARARAAGWEGVFVVGDPAYYRRFGFDACQASSFQSPYAGAYFMVMALTAGGLQTKSGRIDYAPAFAALE
jgi:putative acetyltransferase